MINNGDEHNSAGYAYTTSCLVKGKIQDLLTEDLNASTSNGWTPLMIGIQEEHAQIVKYLSKFAKKANVTLIRNTFSKLSSYTESFNVHFILTKLLLLLLHNV